MVKGAIEERWISRDKLTSRDPLHKCRIDTLAHELTKKNLNVRAQVIDFFPSFFHVGSNSR
jgi:hypothetical protein